MSTGRSVIDVIDQPRHTFAGNPLDRAEALRRDEQWLAQARAHTDGRFLPFHNLCPRLVSTSTQPILGWASADELGAEICEQAVLLGTANGAPRFAVELRGAADDLRASLVRASDHEFVDARSAAMSLAQADTGILAQARSQLDWHQRHGFCSNCGQPTQAQRGGQMRKCSACSTSVFPRTDPVAIMLVTDGDRCLLGQPHGPLVKTGMYSALAGFIEHGESIEAAVRREVGEEAGIHIGDVRYHSSQPWPFPYSLMIGCIATATSRDIQIDPTEMADVRWFERTDVTAAMQRCLAGEAPSQAQLSVPGPIAIAHHLIKAWLETDSNPS
ncbi:MAG: NAD(+) diphosphatase [Pseudomonadales bacterium]